ncbi:hypothetical protein T11_6851 [Trichinella zimbabwensis]|uniref:Uncharacterized protein n=1 Tax=Trichinella zimbabwensis TaxID=268475 RepID=A0A0V1HT32_9BILA|nr:hypothetical protein T11_6851 [Trichinella zimbabwensis]
MNLIKIYLGNSSSFLLVQPMIQSEVNVFYLPTSVNEEDPNSKPPKNLLEGASCSTIRFMCKRNYDNATIED